MPLQRQHRTALISIFSCLSCQIVLRFHLFFLIGSCCWSLCSSCSPCRSYQLYGLIIMLHTASQKKSRSCFFILFNGWPLRGTARAQNDELEEKICSSIQKMKCLEEICQNVKTADVEDGNQSSPSETASSEPERFSPLLCSRQQRDPDFPWNLNQEMYERVKDRSPSTQATPTGFSLTLKEVIL